MSADVEMVDDDTVADTDTADDTGTDEESLLVRLEALEDENERLRQELSAARRTSYRRTALGMAFLGGVGLLGAVLIPGLRDLLVVLGATGLFGGLLTYYLTPERFVAASVGEAVYATLATNLESIAGELELSDTKAYVPVDGDPAVRLYLPEQPLETGGVPTTTDLRDTFVVTSAHRGLSLRPSGDSLRREFVEVTSPVPESPAALIEAVCEALVEQFELVDSADPDIDDAGRATVRVTNSAYGPVDRLDHPVASLLATALADVTDEPVELEVESTDESAYLVTCRWEADNTTDSED
jgi:hypothetical protein